MTNESIVIIESKSRWFDLKLTEVIRYKDLIKLTVKRNYTTRYKQTILGSAWLLINPICTVIMNTVLFGVIAGLSTDGVPMPLFYLLGNIIWNFFSGCITDSANVFTNNAGIFGKIYFPRLTIPIASAITQLFDLGIKMALFFILQAIYVFRGYKVNYSIEILLIPIVLFQLAMLGLGLGIIISSVTTKYRDLQVLIGFGISIWMYITPVVYSINEVPEKWMSLYMLNPVTPAVMVVKKCLLGVGYIPWANLGISLCVTIIISFLGIVIFNQVEKTFMDTV